MVSSLKQNIDTYGCPKYIRCDNEPKLIIKQLSQFCQHEGIEIKFTQPGKPTQNGLGERLNSTMRRECLNLKVFKTIEEAQKNLDKWWNVHNFEDLTHLLKEKHHKWFGVTYINMSSGIS